MSSIELHLGGEFTGDNYDIVVDWIDRNGKHNRNMIVILVSDDQLRVSCIDKDENTVESFSIGPEG